jgi:hypothetical protein
MLTEYVRTIIALDSIRSLTNLVHINREQRPQFKSGRISAPLAVARERSGAAPERRAEDPAAAVLGRDASRGARRAEEERVGGRSQEPRFAGRGDRGRTAKRERAG